MPDGLSLGPRLIAVILPLSLEVSLPLFFGAAFVVSAILLYLVYCFLPTPAF